MSVRHAILKQLKDSRNSAAEHAVEVALATAVKAEQIELADVLLERNRRAGWVALIRAYDRLDESIQKKIVARPRDLFGPLAETMQDVDGPARENVIAIVHACADARLVYLLAEALMDGRTEVRELAGRSFLEAIRRHCDRSQVTAEGGEKSLDAEDVAQVRRAVDFALRRYKSHRQPSALHAALIHERQQDSTIWALFQDPYDDLTRAATVMLRAPSEASLVPALLLALGSALKPAAMAGLASVEAAPVAGAVAAQSFRLLDPALREVARGVTHLKLLAALRKEPPWDLINWSGWLRLIESVGLPAAERLNWLTRLYDAAPAGPESTAWKISTLRALVDARLPEAAGTLAKAVRDPSERIARFAARHLLRGREHGWHEIAAGTLPRSPHLSVRQLMGGGLAAMTVMPGAVGAVAERSAPTTRTFDKAWNEYQKMPPAVQNSSARAAASDPALAEQLRQKLRSGSPQEVAQGVRMLMALPTLTGFRNEIIGMCGHKDPRIAAMAVRLVGRLEDPRLKDLLEAATHHPDARVRANAVESMESLHIADRSQQVLAMLNSRHPRERANAIKALGNFNFATGRECLGRMLSDANPLHRMSALWVVEQLSVLEIMRQVSLVARRDPNLRVRKRALEMLETLSGNHQAPA